jgi:hypothetical protein
MIVEICGSHGHIRADWQSGNVIEIEHYGGDPDAYSGINRIDFEEYRATYKGEPVPGSVDILDVGYWYEFNGSNGYEPPDPNARQMIQCDMKTINVNATSAKGVAGIITGRSRA